MLETIAIILIGLIPGMLSSYLVTTGIRRYTRGQRYQQTFTELPTTQLLHPYLESQDYHYVEGLGYIVGDLSCQYNARSPYLRCAINPSGPCKGCLLYDTLDFPEEQDRTPTTKNS
jgi:hypothetical protein